MEKSKTDWWFDLIIVVGVLGMSLWVGDTIVTSRQTSHVQATSAP